MKLLKIKIHEACQIIAVTDNGDCVLTAAAFTSDDDAEAAENLIYTLLIRLGLLKKDCTPPMSIAEFLRTINATAETYVKELIS